jgi:hypothetical protein
MRRLETQRVLGRVAAINETDQIVAANIEHILRAALAEVRRLEELLREPLQTSASMQSGASVLCGW